MNGFNHYGDLLTLFGTLVVRLPRVEVVSSVWEKDAADVIFGELENFEKLDCDPRFGRDSFFGLTSEDEEHVLALFDKFLCLIAVATTRYHRWEDALVEGVSATIKDADYEASGQ